MLAMFEGLSQFFIGFLVRVMRGPGDRVFGEETTAVSLIGQLQLRHGLLGRQVERILDAVLTQEVESAGPGVV
ncbi:hypothetical protein [Sagittula sp.]|uniref:hypothetical protein n=1 Tax=Sagittula sp. TaxID=2038081 RepID=UPI0035180AAE